MSGTNSTATTQSGTPISSLPEAQDVVATDGVLGVFGGKAQRNRPLWAALIMRPACAVYSRVSSSMATVRGAG